MCQVRPKKQVCPKAVLSCMHDHEKREGILFCYYLLDFVVKILHDLNSLPGFITDKRHYLDYLFWNITTGSASISDISMVAARR
jgi:hypothetical protein